MLFRQVSKEIDLSKITKNKIHTGILLDFYIPEHNLCIEVHGVQHYQVSGFGKDKVESMLTFNRQLDRDAKLRTVCESKGIPLIEIPYDYTYTQILIALTDFKDANCRD